MDNHEEDVQIGASLGMLTRHISERWRQELTALRAAFDQQISSIEAKLNESDHKPVIQATVKNISHLAAERADRARQQAEATASQALAAVESQLHERLDPEIALNAILRASLDDGKRQVEWAQDSAATAEAARSAIEAQYRETLKENQKLMTALDEAQTQLFDARARLKNAKREAEDISLSLTAAHQQTQALTADRGALQQRLKDVTAAKATAEEQYQHLVTAYRKVTDALSQMQRERAQVRAIAAPPTEGESAHRKEITKIAPLKAVPSKSTPPLNPTPASVDSSISTPKQPLQFPGPARDNKRVKIRRDIQANIDGILGALIDLSVGGAQVLLTQVIRPTQLVRLTLPTVDGPVACKGRIVWASFEQPGTSLSAYRTGVKFTDIDTMAVERFMDDFCENPPLAQYWSGSRSAAARIVRPSDFTWDR